MSTVDAQVDVAATPVGTPGIEVTGAREARVGDIAVQRLLPLRLRRSVSAWCFADHYGPMSVDGTTGMRVPPHAHTGLQTVTWLMSGNVLHRDSLGSEQMIRPGHLIQSISGRPRNVSGGACVTSSRPGRAPRFASAGPGRQRRASGGMAGPPLSVPELQVSR